MPTFFEPVSVRFAITPVIATRIGKFSCLRSLAVLHSSTQRIDSSYWDTPDRRVQRQRRALRRLDIDGLAIERLYREGPDGHFRIEREARAGANGPDPGTAARLNVVVSAVRPVVVEHVQRSRMTVRCEEGTALEISIDKGEAWVADKPRRRRRLLELELSLASGSAERLYALASRLIDEAPMRVVLGDDTLRAYRLLGDADGVPGRVDDARRVTAAAIVARSAALCLEQVAGNIAGARDGNADSLHRLRVAIRRFRTVARIRRKAGFAPMPRLVRTDLRWLWRQLGYARDWDVFATETWPAVVDCARPSRALRRFETALSALRAASHARLRRALNGKRCQQLLLALDAFTRGGPTNAAQASGKRGAAGDRRKLARRLLSARARRLRRRSRAAGRLCDLDLHALRIDAKRVRYLAEFFASLEGRSAERYLERVTALQSALGRINDLTVGARLTAEVDARLGGFGSGVGKTRYETFVASAAPALRRRLARDVRRFVGTKPFWR